MRIFTNAKMILPLAFLFVLTGCHFESHNHVTGSGVRQKQKRDVASFTRLETEGALDIEIVCQKTQSIEIEADDNLFPFIKTDVSNNVLHIRSDRSFSVNTPIKVTVAVPNLQAISASGAGTITVADLKGDTFDIDANGATTIKVAGETRQLNIDSNGAGKIDAHRLRASLGVVEAKGVARVDVNVAQQLEVTVSGPSHVTYHGDPVLTQTIHGPGSIQKLESEGS